MQPHPGSSPSSDDAIMRRIDYCPRLGSLRSITVALSELVNAEHCLTAQIAEIIRRDPTLTSRLIKLVNSVFFGLSKRVTNIEEAVFYLGLRQIRELGMATPIIEDFNALQVGFRKVNWRQLWQHSIGVAILTRETLSVAGVVYEDDSDYIMGLVHNVGKVVMAFAFPDEFDYLVSVRSATAEEVCEQERHIIGWDHGRIGAAYLERHALSEDVVQAVRWHHDPASAGAFTRQAAAVQVADYLVRSAGIAGIEKTEPVSEDDWETLPGWQILFGEQTPEVQLGVASLRHSLTLMPTIIKGMV